MGLNKSVFQLWNSYFAPFYEKTVVSIFAVLLRPKSRGTIRLNSANPFHQPAIDPKYLSHQDDVSMLIKGIYFIFPMCQLQGKILDALKFSLV